jgi:O-antigen/teichoic acid export membrane protein
MREKLLSLASDTAIYGVFTILGRFLAFLLYPLYSNFIPHADIGNIANIFAIIAFMNIVYSFGMESAFFRFYDQNSLSISKKAFTHSFLMILSVGILSTVVIAFYSNELANILLDKSGNSYLIIGISLIPLFDSLILIPYALLRMTRRAKRFAMTRFSLLMLIIALNILFVVIFKLGINGVFYANIISSFVGVCVMAPELIKHLNPNFDWPMLKDMLKFGIPTIPANFSAIILQVADKPIIKAMLGAEKLGVYSVNYKLGIPMMLFVSVFEYAWKPFYLTHHTEPDAKKLFSKVLTYFTTLSGGLFLVISLFIDYLVQIPFIGGKLINQSYWHAMGIIPIVLAGYYFNGMFTNFAAGFHITKKTQYLPIAIGIAALVNIGINIALLPVLDIYSGAWATLIAYAVSAAILYYFARKNYPIDYEFGKVAMIISSAALIFLIFKFESARFNGPLDLFLRFLLIFSYPALLITFRIIRISELKSLFRSIQKK